MLAPKNKIFIWASNSTRSGDIPMSSIFGNHSFENVSSIRQMLNSNICFESICLKRVMYIFNKMSPQLGKFFPRILSKYLKF